jgi:hypothetical protein
MLETPTKPYLQKNTDLPKHILPPQRVFDTGFLCGRQDLFFIYNLRLPTFFIFFLLPSVGPLRLRKEILIKKILPSKPDLFRSIRRRTFPENPFRGNWGKTRAGVSWLAPGPCGAWRRGGGGVVWRPTASKQLALRKERNLVSGGSVPAPGPRGPGGRGRPAARALGGWTAGPGRPVGPRPAGPGGGPAPGLGGAALPGRRREPGPVPTAPPAPGTGRRPAPNARPLVAGAAGSQVRE